MSFLLAILSGFADLIKVLILLVLLALFFLAACVYAEELYLRITGRLRARRCWREIEDAQRALKLDEALARPRLGVQAEHVAGRRSA